MLPARPLRANLITDVLAFVQRRPGTVSRLGASFPLARQQTRSVAGRV